MTDQFDLEQGIMGCWHVTDDLDVLFEELVENDHFTKDQASNFVLGLSTIYQAKFDKLFRTFEDFLKQYYTISKELKRTQAQLFDANEELAAMEEANELAADASLSSKSLDELMMEENDRLDFMMEDENGYFLFPK
jgi:hypothetical protein